VSSYAREGTLGPNVIRNNDHTGLLVLKANPGVAGSLVVIFLEGASSSRPLEDDDSKASRKGRVPLLCG